MLNHYVGYSLRKPSRGWSVSKKAFRFSQKNSLKFYMRYTNRFDKNFHRDFGLRTPLWSYPKNYKVRQSMSF